VPQEVCARAVESVPTKRNRATELSSAGRILATVALLSSTGHRRNPPMGFRRGAFGSEESAPWIGER
jgi:hypothetical protein